MIADCPQFEARTLNNLARLRGEQANHGESDTLDGEGSLLMKGVWKGF